MMTISMAISPKSSGDRKCARTANWASWNIVVMHVEKVVHFAPDTADACRDIFSGSGWWHLFLCNHKIHPGPRLNPIQTIQQKCHHLNQHTHGRNDPKPSQWPAIEAVEVVN